MPAYSFKAQFCGPVESGFKLHTIRGKRKHRPRPGQKFFAYYAMRTKQCRKLLESTITRVEDIRMEVDGGGQAQVYINGDIIAPDEREMLAKKDGFEDWNQMARFWNGRYPFDGDLIHWKPVAK